MKILFVGSTYWNKNEWMDDDDEKKKKKRERWVGCRKKEAWVVL